MGFDCMKRQMVFCVALVAVLLSGCRNCCQSSKESTKSKTFDECYVYCPDHGKIYNCTRDREALGKAAGDHNTAHHEYKPVAKIYRCGSTTDLCDQ